MTNKDSGKCIHVALVPSLPGPPLAGLAVSTPSKPSP